MKTLILLFIMTLFCSSLSSEFEGYVKYIYKNERDSIEMKEYKKIDKSALLIEKNGIQLKSLYNKKDNKVLMIMVGMNMIMEMDMTDISKKVSVPKNNFSQPIKTGKTKIIAGMITEEITATNNDNKVSLWIGKDFNINMNKDKLSNLFKILSFDDKSNKNNMSFLEYGILEIESKLIQVIANEIVTEKIDDSFFEIPKDYQIMKVPTELIDIEKENKN